MTTPDDLVERVALREKVARALCQEKCAFFGEPPCWGLDPAEYVIEPWSPDTCDEPGCGALADAAIAIALEEAAQFVQDECHDHDDAHRIAAAIRAMIPTGNAPAQDDTGSAE
jgi:hypothetical protein